MRRLFGIDARGLALFRIGLAAVVLLDLAQRAADLYAHYADAGVLSRVDVLHLFPSLHEWGFCLHMIFGSVEGQSALFCIHALAAFAMLLGYRTGAATFVVWFLLASVQLRNPLIGNSGDTLLRMSVLWGCFLPLGTRLSLDHVRRQTRAAPAPVLSVAAVALLAQLAIVFWMAAYAQLTQEAWWDGRTLRLAFQDHLWGTSIGRMLAQDASLCALLSRAAAVSALLAPVLLLLSGLYAPLRVAVVAALSAASLSTVLLLDVGLLPWVLTLGLLTFCPPAFWDRVAGWQMLRRLRHRAAAMRWWQRVLSALRRDRCKPSVLEPWSVWLANGLCMVILAAVVMWSVGVARASAYRAPWYADWLVGSLFLQQDWQAFAHSRAPTGWIVIQARLAGGREIDLMAAGGRLPALAGDTEIDWKTPRGPSFYANGRWRSLLRHVLTVAGERPAALLYGRYLCREWNMRHSGDEQLRVFHIVHVSPDVAASDGESDTRNEVVWWHDCFL